VSRFRLDLERELFELREALCAGRWTPSRLRLLFIRDPKPRTISVLPFRDRVVHQALGAVLAPAIERRAIRDTYPTPEQRVELAGPRRDVANLRGARPAAAQRE
jgi:RNA-directed DNA polymerase